MRTYKMQIQNNNYYTPAFGTNYPNFPEKIAVAINKSCNLRCSYCPNSQIKSKITEHVMPQKLFLKILDNLKNLDFDGIFYFHTFNEPLLNKNLEAYIELLNKYIPKAETTMYSNGIFLTENKLQSIKQAGGIRKFIITEHTKTKSFINRLKNISDDLLANIYVRRTEDLKLTNRGGLVVNKENLAGHEPCTMVKTNLYSNSYGKIILCADDYNEIGDLGNLNTQTFEEIIESPLCKKVVETLGNGIRTMYPICKKCDRVMEKQSPRIPAIEVKRELLAKKS